MDLQSRCSDDVEMVEVIPNYAFHFKNVLSKDYCDKLIQWTDTQVWEDRLTLTTGIKEADELERDLRTSKRIKKVSNQEFADILTARINKFMPQILEDGRTIRPVFETFRFDKYVQGGHFRPHYDDSKMRSDGVLRGESSVFTLMIWLNDEYEGGATHFLPCKLHDKDVYVRGKAGDALVFWQRGMLHEGTDTVSGTKIICHSNVMYSPHVGEGKRPIPQRFRFQKTIRDKLKNLKKDYKFDHKQTQFVEEAEKAYKNALEARQKNQFRA